MFYFQNIAKKITFALFYKKIKTKDIKDIFLPYIP